MTLSKAGLVRALTAQSAPSDSQSFVVFFSATVVHQAITLGLGAILGLRPFGAPYAAVAGLALGNAVVGVAAFQIAELLPGAVERRRMGRGRIRR